MFGKEEDIRVQVGSVTNTNTIHENVLASAFGDPGASKLPDMFVSYPKTVLAMPDDTELVDYYDYFTEEELNEFIPAFLEEGVIHERLSILPVAKSTEVMFINKTAFDRFAKETGAKMEDLKTWEGLFAMAEQYAAWTDNQTPDIPDDGKNFFVHDYHFNYFQVGVESLGENFFKGENLAFGPEFQTVWEPYAKAALSGGVWLRSGYATEPLRTGDSIVSVASSASVLYYSDEVTYADNTSEKVEIVSMPYAEGKMDTVTIENAEYTAMPESNSIEKTYMYRYEQSGTSYDIRVRGQEIDDSDKELLEGIVLKLEDEGNKDAPWPWEGEPLEPVLAEQMVGSYTIVPEYIPFKEAQGVMQIMDHQFVKQGNQVFHLLENKLDTYEYSESGLEFVSSMELDDDFEYLSGDSSGMLYLSPGIGDVIGVKDGEKALQTTVDGDLNMHPSGEWGISFWVNSDTQKIANQGGNLTAEPWILTGLNKDEERKGLFSMIDDVQITNSHIMVAGSMAAEDEGTKIVVYDYDGNQLLKLGGEDISSPDKLGSITGMAETENGFVAADGNMREIQFWAKDGTHVGAISTEDIFGVSYPWLEDMQLLDDGSLLIMLTQERDDGSANELMFFRLTGF